MLAREMVTWPYIIFLEMVIRCGSGKPDRQGNPIGKPDRDRFDRDGDRDRHVIDPTGTEAEIGVCYQGPMSQMRLLRIHKSLPLQE